MERHNARQDVCVAGAKKEFAIGIAQAAAFFGVAHLGLNMSVPSYKTWNWRFKWITAVSCVVPYAAFKSEHWMNNCAQQISFDIMEEDELRRQQKNGSPSTKKA